MKKPFLTFLLGVAAVLLLGSSAGLIRNGLQRAYVMDGLDFNQKPATNFSILSGSELRVSRLIVTNGPFVIDAGKATLASGTVTVTTTNAHATNRFTLAYRADNGVLSTVGFKSIVNDTSFVIFSGNPSDTNSVDWTITKP